ncbi:spore cortex biosynthesis protein YabQ [Anaerotignum sp.]|uniref:spore cortex biosynthesis protein YabQ n=1 Tax=Anaerotignum sp. TaxID=2039241 RepID=UPI0028B0FE7A|nr:spore cortex biosynthesis protein YabQ [Anaerotignum sp.]
MILSLQGQAQLFLLTVLLGGALGLVYDCLRIFRHIIPHKRLWVQIEDGVFWIGSIFFVFAVMLGANAGEIRFFTILGMFGGMSLYFLTLSRLVIAVSDKVIYVVKKVLLLLFTIVMTPFRLVYLVIRRPLMKAGFFCGKIKKKVLHSCNFYAKIRLNAIRRDWRIAVRKKQKSGDKPDGQKDKTKKRARREKAKKDTKNG